jgi:hypothetical protein
MEIRDGCKYAELNEDNGISCTPGDLCNLCERKTLTPEERA